MSREASFTFVADPAAYRAQGVVARIAGSGTGKKELFAQLAKGLGLPAHFGHNWDALEESLREFSWAKGATTISLVHDTVPAKLGADDLRTYLDILADAVTDLRAAKDEVPALHVVFPATERERIRKLLA